MRKLVLAALAALVLTAVPAQALILTPTTAGMLSGNLGPSNCEPGCVYDAFGLLNDGSLSLLYKADVGNATSPATVYSGTFAGSYTTVFSNTAFDPENATISYVSPMPAITCGTCYLVIKDGNATPSYYFYNLSLAPGWNGTDDIIMTGFWPGSGPLNGAISHVAIWGASTASVPEPGLLALMGIGLTGMGIGLRRRSS